MVVRNARRRNYEGFERWSGKYSEVKVGSRVVLKRRRPPAAPLVRKGKALNFKPKTAEYEQCHRRLMKAGVPIVRIKGRMGPLDPKKPLAKQRMDTLILEKLRPPTYEDLVKNVDAVAEAIYRASSKRFLIDSHMYNYGIDADGKLKLLDFWPLITHESAESACADNADAFIRSIRRRLGDEKADKLRSLLMERLAKRGYRPEK